MWWWRKFPGDVEERIDRQEHLGQFRVDSILPEMGHAGEGKKENEVQQPRGQRYKKKRVTRMTD